MYFVHRCRDPEALQQWIGPIPRLPAWTTSLPVLTALRLALTDGRNEVEQAVNARRVLDHHADTLRWLDHATPQVHGRALAPALADWLVQLSATITTEADTPSG